MELLKHLSDQEVMQFIGTAKGEPDERMLRDIVTLKQRVLDLSKPRYIMREFSWNPPKIQEVDFVLTGDDINRLLKKSHHCILLAVTLGTAVDAELRRLQLKDMGKALVFDCCANAAIEHVCDEIQNKLEVQYHKQGLYLTDRYSCGYGDLPVTIQRDFLNVLEAQKKIGLYADESCILHPTKSVTAILGIADCVQPAILRGCAFCSLREDCIYRKGGITCGG